MFGRGGQKLVISWYRDADNSTGSESSISPENADLTARKDKRTRVSPAEIENDIGCLEFMHFSALIFFVGRAVVAAPF